MTETEDIISACQRGDRTALQQVFDRHHRQVFRLCARMVSEQDAADLTQQVFLNVFRSIEGFRGASRFDTWLHRVTVNECLQFNRSRERHSEVSLSSELTTIDSPAIEASEQGLLLQNALDALDPDLRSIFLLREVEQLSYDELAESLGIAAGTVASRLNRARKQLKTILTKLGWEP